MSWLARHRRLAFAAICTFWTAVVFVGHFFPTLPFISIPWRGEQGFEDLLRTEGRKTATRDDFIFLGIDQQSEQLDAVGSEEIAGNRAFELMTERPFPWSREIWVLLLDRLFGAGARLVIFDLVFNNPNDGDPAFRAALDRYHDRVVVGMNIDTQNNTQIVLPNAQLIPSPAQTDDRVGFVNYWNDELDGKLRAARFFTSERQLAGVAPASADEVYASMSSRALTKLGRSADIPQDQRDHLFRFSSNDAYPPFPLWQVFHPAFWKANYADGAIFKDKVVIVGASSQIRHDFIVTPLNPATPGPAVHLQVMAATEAHEFLRQTPTRVMLGLVLLAGIIGWGLIPFLRRPILSLFSLIAITAIYLAIARLAYDRSGFLVASVPVLSTLLLCGVSTLGIDYAIERMEKLRTRRTLERYVSKNLVKEILENPRGYYNSLTGSRIPATMLFSDIVGFTTFSEDHPAEEVFQLLREFHRRMEQVVFDNGGTVDNYIGDCIMATFGVPQPADDDAVRALSCARAMIGALKNWNGRRAAAGEAQVDVRIGCQYGTVVLGAVGSERSLSVAVVGDTCNVASRLQDLCRELGADICVGNDLVSAIGATASEGVLQGFVDSGGLAVRGRDEPVHVWALMRE